jgi:hypothetical protein
MGREINHLQILRNDGPRGIMRKEFYNSNNQLLTRSLFWETTFQEDTAIYTLKRWDITTPGGKPLKSLYKLYMDMNDITEYDFANKYFDGWEHWQTVSKSWYLKDEVAKWREELEIRVVADALKLIQAEALSDSKYAYAANRYLADRGWKGAEAKKSTKGAGRPSKASIQEEAARIAAEAHDIEADLKRLNIKVN